VPITIRRRVGEMTCDKNSLPARPDRQGPTDHHEGRAGKKTGKR